MAILSLTGSVQTTHIQWVQWVFSLNNVSNIHQHKILCTYLLTNLTLKSTQILVICCFLKQLRQQIIFEGSGDLRKVFSPLTIILCKFNFYSLNLTHL